MAGLPFRRFPDSRLPVAIGLVAVYAALLSRFQLPLLFTDTVLTGGDSASWLQPLLTLRNEYLPHLRLFGYSQSNFFGYLEGQHYFPLPFLVPALLSYLIPPTVALKLATVAGAFALPATTYYGASRLTRNPWLGLTASGASLLFLFNENYTMFGGNFLSTFAGEFAYSWAIALLPPFVSSVWEDHSTRRWSPRSGVLLGLMGLCHFFVFMVAFFLPFFFAFRRDALFGKDPWRRGKSPGMRGFRQGPGPFPRPSAAAGPFDQAGHALRVRGGFRTEGGPGASGATLGAAAVPGPAVPGSAVPGPATPGPATPGPAVPGSAVPGALGALPLPERLVLGIAGTYLVALALMAFWFLPMIATRTWAQSIAMIWHFPSFSDFARRTAMPIWVGAAALSLLVAVKGGSARRQGAFVLYGLGACAFLFLVAPALGVPDIRFVPPALVLSIFAGTIAAGRLLPAGRASGRAAAPREDGLPDPRRRESDSEARSVPKHRGLSGRPHPGTPVASAAAALNIVLTVAFIVAAISMARAAPTWFRWNYSGYEAKVRWDELVSISKAFSGGIEDGRILWEKQDQRDNADFGSERAFENLYYFTGRPSTEGIHYGSSFMARAATYLQSTYSLHPVDPEPDRLYSVVDPPSWPLRFSQINARHIIAYSEEITADLAARPEFRLAADFGKFKVFEYRLFPRSYVELLDPGALSVVEDSPGGFKTDFYRFFRDYELIRRPFVPASFADGTLRGTVAASYVNYDALYRRWAGSGEWEGYPAAVAAGPRPQAEKVDDFTVSFVTGSPGAPHLIKLSYAPGWRSAGGERIYPVSPGFMLIFPKTERVVLRYGRSGVEWLALALTLLGLPSLLIFSGPLVERGIRRYRPLFGVAFLLFFGAVAFLVHSAGGGTAAMKADLAAARTLDLRDASARERARALVVPYAQPRLLEEYDDRTIFDAYRIRAELYRRDGELTRTRELLALLRRRYSHTRAAAALPRY